MAKRAACVFPSGDDLGRARGTDFYSLDGRLTADERAVRDRVRLFCEEHVVPIAGDYWEAAELPAAVKKGYASLRVAGGSLTGYGCPGLSPLLGGMVVLELARGDGSLSTFNAVHSGLAKTSIGHRYHGGFAMHPSTPVEQRKSIENGKSDAAQQI